MTARQQSRALFPVKQNAELRAPRKEVFGE